MRVRVLALAIRLLALVVILSGGYFVATVRASGECANGKNCYLNVSSGQPYCQSNGGYGKYISCTPITSSIMCRVRLCGSEEFGEEEDAEAEEECTECSR